MYEYQILIWLFYYMFQLIFFFPLPILIYLFICFAVALPFITLTYDNLIKNCHMHFFSNCKHINLISYSPVTYFFKLDIILTFVIFIKIDPTFIQW